MYPPYFRQASRKLGPWTEDLLTCLSPPILMHPVAGGVSICGPHDFLWISEIKGEKAVSFASLVPAGADSACPPTMSRADLAHVHCRGGGQVMARTRRRR